MLRYAITDLRQFPGDARERQAEQLRVAARWAAPSNETRPNMVQLREKDLQSGELCAFARELRSTLAADIALLINTRADIALAVAAEGVHLPSTPGGLTPDNIRTLYARAGLPAPVISVSCHTLAEVAAARAAGATHILLGPIFEKRVHGDLVSPGIGLERLAQAAVAAGTVLVLALGGITEPDIPACLAAGVAGIAGIRMFGQSTPQRQSGILAHFDLHD